MRNIIVALLALLPAFLSAQKDEYKVGAIGFYNLENLFDTLDNPAINDQDFLPSGGYLWDTKKYIAKQFNMAKVISQIATDLTPDGLAILGVAEVENRKVLEDLCTQEAIKSRNYQIVHYDSPDERGIDCGLLYQAKYFTPIGSKALPVILKDPKTGEIDFTRDILYVAGMFDGEPIHIMVGHWPSRRGGESASAWARAAAAGVCKAAADSLRAINPDTKIVMMGDLNDDPNNKSVKVVLQSKNKSDQVGKDDFYNPFYDMFKEGNGTLGYRDAWNLFDQIMVSKGFVYKKSGGWQLYKAQVFRQPWMLQTEGQYRGYPLRTFSGFLFLNGFSDHLPTFLYFLKKKEVVKP